MISVVGITQLFPWLNMVEQTHHPHQRCVKKLGRDVAIIALYWFAVYTHWSSLTAHWEVRRLRRLP